MIVQKILGLALAGIIGYATWFLYTDYNMLIRMLRRTTFDEIIGVGYLRDLQLVVLAVAVFVMLWIAEKIWDAAAAKFWPQSDH